MVLDGNILTRIHHTLASSPNWYSQDTYGFGMIDVNTYDTWYPYLVHHLLGNSLDVGDVIFESSSSQFDVVSTLAWEHDGQRKVLLIGKTDTVVSANLDLPISPGSTVTVHRIEGEGRIGTTQEATVAYAAPLAITLNGYSVTLLSF